MAIDHKLGRRTTEMLSQGLEVQGQGVGKAAPSEAAGVCWLSLVFLGWQQCHQVSASVVLWCSFSAFICVPTSPLQEDQSYQGRAHPDNLIST